MYTVPSNHLRQRGSISPSSCSISKNPFFCCPSLYGTLYALFSCICPTCLFAKTHQPLPPGQSLSPEVEMARFPFLLLLVFYLNPSSSSSSSSVLTINYEDENPPAPNPGFSVDRKRRTFLLDGLPFRYASGSAHYFRIPRALWRDRLRKLRAAGFNAVQTYVEWSRHQPEEEGPTFQAGESTFLRTFKNFGETQCVRKLQFWLFYLSS